MDDSPGSGRPQKRVKYAREAYDEPIVAIPANLNLTMGASSNRPADFLPVSPTFSNPWPPQPDVVSPSQLLVKLSEDHLSPSWTTSPLPVPQTAQADVKHIPTTPSRKPSLSREPSQTASQPGPPPPSVADDSLAMIHPQSVRISRPTTRFVNPFTQEGGTRLPELRTPRFARPENGQVNGYVKFHWPTRRDSARRSISEGSPSTPSGHPSLGNHSLNNASLNNNAMNGLPHAFANPHRSHHGSSTTPPSSSDVVEEVISSSVLSGTVSQSPTTMYAATPSPNTPFFMESPPAFSEPSWGSGPGSVMALFPLSPPEPSLQVVIPGEPPRMMPPHFGYQAKMDAMDRRLWDFYVKNWCPGRSVLKKTNLWLKDFAQMQKSEGIRAAITSLAGVYIYDYLPDPRLHQRIEQRYDAAGEHFEKLLNSSQGSDTSNGDEIITMAVILSMRDIIITEGRRKKPYEPRWLTGFRHGEHFLHQTDPGGRFWRDNNIQVNGLRLSQSIIVGRAVILAQPMMVLPTANDLDPEQEASRFGWLLYGTETEMYEIHGGCGFSRKLLYTISQITYCAARMLQEPNSTIIPVTARYLQRELTDMIQWSTEGRQIAVSDEPVQTINWVREKPGGYVVDTHEDMTDVTAEAWRIAIFVYLQCRVLRLPRNHPEVVANLSDLAKCISVMPTSGSHFTAQAPLLPVFFLGLLATDPAHKRVSQVWFHQVVQTPVRSSVPPLWEALQDIWIWIDDEVPLPSASTTLAKSFSLRTPWWESLVAAVEDRLQETLCLT